MKNQTSLIKITKNFQVTLPSKLRSAFKLVEGDYLEAEVKDGAFVFRPKKLVDIDPEQAWFWTEEWQKGEREVDEEIKQGKMKTFNNVDDFINDLNK